MAEPMDKLFEGQDTSVRSVLSATVSAERLSIVGGLIRTTGDWDMAEDSVQDAVEKALARWPVEGIPDNPGAWLTTVARNRALDVLRRQKSEHTKLAQMMEEMQREPTSSDNPDDRLRLIFTCCHPALSVGSQVALTLKAVMGLSTPEIARAFLTSEATLAQRLLRAKRKIANAGIPFCVPPDHLLSERTTGVLAVVYLIFNAGYSRPDHRLADEALQLLRQVESLMPEEDEAHGLLALILFQHARREARFDSSDDPVPMEEQDRSSWDQTLIEEGRQQLRQAASSGRPPGPYRLQAAIAKCHVTAPDPQSTDWVTIVRLYDALLIAQPTPVIALSRAIAIGFRDGPEAGLETLASLAETPQLTGYHLMAASRAYFLRQAGRTDDASSAYRRAYELATNDANRRFLRRQLEELKHERQDSRRACQQRDRT
jgi:RNA polymerase sigma-70 factor (ECF subfamily)